MRINVAAVAVAGCLFVVGGTSSIAQDKAPAEPGKIEAAKVELGRPVEFQRDIAPILDANCRACHNDAISEGKLVLENAASILKGGDSGPAVVAKDPEKSLLFLLASRSQESFMPPLPNKVEAKPLTPEQLGLLKQWILEGAVGGTMSTSTNIEWQPLPAGLHAIYSAAISPWGRFAASGRANQVYIYDGESGDEVARLIDPNLAKVEHKGKLLYPEGAADRDFVHSLAFSPDGNMLATGGFRVVKLWQRPQNVQKLKLAIPAEVTATAASADGQKLAVAAADNSILLINLADGSTIRTLAGHGAKVTSLEFWPTLEEASVFEKAATDTATDAQAAARKAAVAAELAAANPKAEKLAAEKTAAEAAVQPANDAAKKAADEKAAFDKKVAEQTKLVSSSLDKTVRIWNPADGSQKLAITSPAAVNDATFNLDATQVISADSDNKLRVWDAVNAAAAPVREIAGHEKPVTAVALVRPAGAQIVSGSEDGTVRVWNIADGAAVRAMKHDGAVTSVAVRPNGQSAASAGTNNLVRLWNLADGNQIAEIKGDLAANRRIVELGENKTVAEQKVALADATVKAAEANSKERDEAVKKAAEAKAAADKALPEAQAKEKQENEKLAAAKAELAKTPDNEELKKKVAEAEKAAAAQVEATKKAVDAQAEAVKGQERADKALAAAKAQVEAAAAAKKGTEEQQAGAVAQLDEATKAAAAAEKPVAVVAFSPDGKSIAAGRVDGLVTLYSGATGVAFETFAGHGGPVTAICFAGNGALVSGSAEKAAIVWNTNPAWTLVGQFGPPKDKPLELSASPFVNRVLALDFSDDGKFLATGGGDPSRSGELMIWDVASQALVRDIENAHSDTVMGVEFSRDGKFVLSGGSDKFVKIHEVETGKHVRSFEGHTHHVLDVSWKADGATIASAGADNAVKVWNVETGEQVRTIGTHTKQVTAIQFIGVGDNILTCGGDKLVVLHQTSDGKKVRDFAGGSDYMYAAAVSRDEGTVVAGGEDGVFRIWNGKDGNVKATVNPPQ